jgi:hypothetical protein
VCVIITCIAHPARVLRCGGAREEALEAVEVEAHGLNFSE